MAMKNFNTAKELIDRFSLAPHPERGFYKETYRSPETIPTTALPKRFKNKRSYGTAISFLLEQGNFSAFHKIQSDECWHFYAGETLIIHIILLNGRLLSIRLGPAILAGDTFQYLVPAGAWFAVEPAAGTSYALVGCTVAPGFDFSDFVLAVPVELSKQFPQHRLLIERLCR